MNNQLCNNNSPMLLNDIDQTMSNKNYIETEVMSNSIRNSIRNSIPKSPCSDYSSFVLENQNEMNTISNLLFNRTDSLERKERSSQPMEHHK